MFAIYIDLPLPLTHLWSVYVPCSPLNTLCTAQLHTAALLFVQRHRKQPVLPHVDWKNAMAPGFLCVSQFLIIWGGGKVEFVIFSLAVWHFLLFLTLRNWDCLKRTDSGAAFFFVKANGPTASIIVDMGFLVGLTKMLWCFKVPDVVMVMKIKISI